MSKRNYDLQKAPEATRVTMKFRFKVGKIG